MKKLDSDIGEIMDFLSGWEVSHPDIAAEGVKPKLKAAYKQFHSVLIWRVALDMKDQDEKLRLHANEAVSDVSHAFFLTLISLYKGSRSSLRSGIENYVRVIVASKGLNPSTYNSVFDLFSAARALFSSDTVGCGLLDRSKAAYGELCKSVHSAKIDYLARTVPFNRLSVYDQTQFFSNIEKIRETCALINQLSYWMWSARLSIVGHENGDFVRDSLPRSLKRSASARSSTE